MGGLGGWGRGGGVEGVIYINHEYYGRVPGNFPRHDLYTPYPLHIFDWLPNGWERGGARGGGGGFITHAYLHNCTLTKAGNNAAYPSLEGSRTGIPTVILTLFQKWWAWHPILTHLGQGWYALAPF